MKTVSVTTGAAERAVLTAMLQYDRVLARIAPKYEKDMFPSRYANILANLAVPYYREYNRAPGMDIVTLLNGYAQTHPDAITDVQLCERLLESLDPADDEAVNVEYLVDQAGELFNERRLRRMAEAVIGSLDVGRRKDAEEILAAYQRVDLGAGALSDPFTSDEELEEVFSGGEEVLIRYKGALGKFFQNSLCRDGFVAFQAPEKTGKTFLLIDVAWQALKQRRKVAFFEVGDLSSRQMKTRLSVRAASHPFVSPTGRWPYDVRVPTRIVPTDSGKPPYGVEYETRTFDGPVSRTAARAAFNRFMEHRVKSKDRYFGMAIYPNSSIDVAGIRAVLDSWEAKEGFVPDVIVIDYADILLMPGGKTDKREAINDCWKQLRRLSQERHCLVVTATQSDADAYERQTMTRRNFSDDHRKLAHVTGIVGINVTAEEKERGLARLNWIVLREGEFSSTRCVTIAGSLAIGRPAILSAF